MIYCSYVCCSLYVLSSQFIPILEQFVWPSGLFRLKMVDNALAFLLSVLFYLCCDYNIVSHYLSRAAQVGQLREVSNKAHNAELKLFLEVELGLVSYKSVSVYCFFCVHILPILSLN